MAESERNRRFEDDLVGLDPEDPEAQAFAAHLDRMQRCEPGFTIEASLSRVEDFAESSSRAGGLRWWVAATIVVLIVLGVIVASWDIIVRAIQWLSAG
ncbi:hypothetical protein FHX82_006144 [Amycolatopsis bartoniae]|uniref:Uncharacterized protein n=1 Tax=Amycolatopsis bartoniae TaxID=941986 RepID=A0A8H9IV97_9PSEU|nr:hypothetical protein [Amycolatopsis bartoniae]MBB2939058.1 hypothetical protein [Amycolatopsis bartoniae]TVT06321.1 hypothetical protein FNH07_20420 [Amycolatopsis bartoniae]GHF65243.1 hypothetical protein GCM10017566_43470 [Amycolatopsis bartoniae]